MLGTSGRNGERVAVVTASARTVPACNCPTDSGPLLNESGICPPRRSLIARRDTTSPSVRASTSTPPPGAYGTKICTGLVGNSDWADAMPPVATIATRMAAIRDHLPMLCPPDPVVLLSPVMARKPARCIAARRKSPSRAGMLTIPLAASRFDASPTTIVAREAREDGMAVVQEKASPQTSEGRASDEKASQDKTWHGIILQTLKR